MNEPVKIYTNPKIVSSVTHDNVCVSESSSYEFARHVNAAPLTTAEFAIASREFPIVFSRVDESYTPVALLGLRDQENLFLAEDGSWTGRYVPASLRWYPFVLSQDEKAKTYTLCLDEASDRVNRTGDGDPLFVDDGEASPYLKRMGEFAKVFQRNSDASRVFSGELASLGLLKSGQLRFKLPDGKTGATRGFFSVDQDRLKDLDAEVVRELLVRDKLLLINAHLLSLNCLSDLAQKAGMTAMSEGGLQVATS